MKIEEPLTKRDDPAMIAKDPSHYYDTTGRTSVKHFPERIISLLLFRAGYDLRYLLQHSRNLSGEAEEK